MAIFASGLFAYSIILLVQTSGCLKFIISVGVAKLASTPNSLANLVKARLSLGKQGPPKPNPALRYFPPIRESLPSDSKIIL